MRHDTFDFESELGWEGSNDKVLAIMRGSDYFVPPTQARAGGAGLPPPAAATTLSRLGRAAAPPPLPHPIAADTLTTPPFPQCNTAGVPQGGYLDMTAYIADQGFKTGKGGYQKVRRRRPSLLACLFVWRGPPRCRPDPKPTRLPPHPTSPHPSQDYPPLYVLRPDGSTLYTFRDVVYSFRKLASSDLVLTVVCSEQDLAQQKVALAVGLLNPGLAGRQYHASYDLVRLPSGRMSGRRGRYLLADDLYDELREAIRETMREKYAAKGEEVEAGFFDKARARNRRASAGLLRGAQPTAPFWPVPRR